MADRRSRTGWARLVLSLTVVVLALSACDFKENDHYRDGRHDNGGQPGKVTVYSSASTELAWIYNEECNDDSGCFRDFLREKYLEEGDLDDRGRLVIGTIIAAPDSNYASVLDGWSVNVQQCIALQTTEAGEFVQPGLFRIRADDNPTGIWAQCWSGESSITGYSYDS